MMSETSRPSAQECRELVNRVLASSCFRRATRMREFLIHVTESALDGHPDNTTEIAIGCQVFGRPADYNPGEDNIVRSEARQLRAKLDLYFQTEGKREPIVLQIPKGAYLPVFTERAAMAAPAGAVTDALPAPEPSESIPSAARAPQRRWTERFLAGLVMVLAVLCVVAWWKNSKLMQAVAVHPSATRNWVWDRMFDTSHESTVVVADSSAMELQDIAQKRLSLDEYIQPPAGLWNDPDNAKRRILERIASRQLTSIADVVVTAGIIRESEAYANHAIVKFARKVDLRDFKGKNHIVLLGSPRSNPWVELFQGSMNFRFEYEPATNRSSIRNLAPRANESPVYTAVGRETTPGETYGVIGLLTNLTGEGNVLIIAGATMEGTEAAGDFLLHPQYSKQLLDALQKAGIQPNGHFEVLLRTRTGAGTSRDPELLACRPLASRPPVEQAPGGFTVKTPRVSAKPERK